MKDALVLGIVGQKGSGKGTVAQYLVDHHSAAHFKFSDPLTDTLNRLHLPITRDHQIRLALFFREQFGQDILGRVILADVEASHASIVVVDGIRYWDEVNLLKKLPRFNLIDVAADVQRRYERTLTRGEKEDDADYSFEEFVAEHQRPTELTIEAISTEAKIHLDNNGSFDHLYQQMESMISRISSLI